MPRVKIVRDDRADSPKKIATRSRAQIKPEAQKKLSPAVVPKGKRIIPVSKTNKSLVPVSQQKQKDIDVRGNKKNKKRANAAGNVNKDGFTNHNEIVKKITKQTGMVIYIYDDSEDDSDDDDDRKDSRDENDSNSTDDYEPDTEDEEEYRSRSYYW